MVQHDKLVLIQHDKLVLAQHHKLVMAQIMAKPNEKLAASLQELHNLQKDGRRVFHTTELSRVHRERLIRNNFLREVVPGWLISSNPGVHEGDTTPWYASFWEFCAFYCQERFANDWHLSPEQSLLLYAESTVIPRQVIIYSPKGSNNKLDLLFNTSIYDLKINQMPKENEVLIKNNLRLYAPDVALIKVSENFFINNPVEACVTLSSIPDNSNLLSYLLDGGHSVIAGRLAGAFRHIKRDSMADRILNAMKFAGYDVRETNPFQKDNLPQPTILSTNPMISRVQNMWALYRNHVLDIFPSPPGIAKNHDAYLKNVDRIYKSDVYHSLSIEGYNVTPTMIEGIQLGHWGEETHEVERKNRDVLAVEGYKKAFDLVENTIIAIMNGSNPADQARASHHQWYQALFQPCVETGLIPPSSLEGYRRHPVYLRGSRHVPPRWEILYEVMPALFDLLHQEPKPAVRAVLGHWLFGYIHPYPDGNGRLARFLMNVMMASGGYPWTIVKVENRNSYMSALEKASVDMDIRPFAEFIAMCLKSSLDQN